MKVKIDNKVYLQRYDVAVMLHTNSEFPKGMLGEIFNGSDGPEIFIMGEGNDYAEFAYSFEKPDYVEWLMNQEWILDYDECEKMPLDELIGLRRSMTAIRDYDLEAFEKQTKEYKEANSQSFYEESAKDLHRIHSIELMIEEKRGKIKFEFPDDYARGDAEVEEKPKSFFNKILEFFQA